MIQDLITSETRIRLLLHFFLNPDNRGYLRQLAGSFNESSNGVRVELNKLTAAKILKSEQAGKIRFYLANREHPLFDDIRNIVLKSTGIDKVISNIIRKIGDLRLAFIRGDYAAGKDSGLIDLVLVGNNLNTEEIERVRLKTEEMINRKISILNLTWADYLKMEQHFTSQPVLLLHESGEICA